MIISALDSNYVLDVSGSKVNNGTNVQLYSGNGSDAQNWNIEKFVSKYEKLDALANSNKNTIADGTYEISTKLNTGYVLDMTSSSLSMVEMFRFTNRMKLLLKDGSYRMIVKVM